ncbi:hypothetical protein [Candidatus Enterococcus willemsii]|uniref:Phage shock protein G n=1 Tax=Candidatus Enterococcus willemsii TaxID=1857215 RepID=A0ABQ6Z054_9ENTE|nr:hypothetical protein [Enterococcus sp. CU12B]KAF1304044.1 hypothetical protein BAU17_03910 [Enterococcus sp. CU12B]
MNDNTLVNIVKLVVGLIIAGLVIKIVLALLGGLFYVAFRFGIPLIIAILVVRWLSERSTNRRRNY